MTDRLIDVRRGCGIDGKAEKTKVMRISRQLIRNTNYDNQKQLENVEYFNFLSAFKQVMQDIHVILNP